MAMQARVAAGTPLSLDQDIRRMSKSLPLPERKKGLTPVTVLLSAAFVLLATGCFLTAFAEDGSVSGNLSRLEEKYFQHDFAKDEASERIERLEKLVYGETRSGSNEERTKMLMSLVPAEPAPETRPPAPAPETRRPPPENRRIPLETRPAPPTRPLASADPLSDSSEANEPIANDNSYPAVTAMEKKLLGRDYVGESVGKRLDRLEIKAFGKTSASEDLQDRVDRLKSTTGIDVARAKPPGSEWADEDEDPMTAGSQGVQPFTGISGDDPGSQRYLRKQAQNSLNRPRPSYDPYAGTGTFGAGGGTPYTGSSSGSFGMAPPRGGQPGGMPPSAPDFSRAGDGSAPLPAPAMGVSQQISLLEREVFRKTFDKETILNRLSRLETTVFPQDKPALDKSLPERMSRLTAAVPISQATAPPPAQPKRHRSGDPDFPDLDFGDPTLPSSAARPQGPGGLSKIINGLGNVLSGGFTGSYATTPGHLVTDPSTGLLYDQYTGTLIDPMTGAVVGRRAVGNSYQTYGGFNSGLSPMSPYGGMGFGFGSPGIRMGGWP
jgi:hypothetical protein